MKLDLVGKGRILALDLGRRRIGMAVSDELLLTAQGLPTLHRTNIREDLGKLAQLAAEWQAMLILIGNPVHMNGMEGSGSTWAREFAEKLEGYVNCPVLLWDERLTTVEANRVLRQSGISREKRGRAVDRLAAVILLQNYLESSAAAGEVGDHAG